MTLEVLGRDARKPKVTVLVTFKISLEQEIPVKGLCPP